MENAESFTDTTVLAGGEGQESRAVLAKHGKSPPVPPTSMRGGDLSSGEVQGAAAYAVQQEDLAGLLCGGVLHDFTASSTDLTGA